MENSYSFEITNMIIKFLKDVGLQYNFDQEKGMLHFSINIKCRLQSIQYLVLIGEKEYNVYGILPIRTNYNDAAQLKEMTEFVCRANYGLRNGNFELDCRNGEIRYKSYVDCDGALPTMKVIERSIVCPAAMFKRYAEGILQILFDGMSAVKAIELCESNITQLM